MHNTGSNPRLAAIFDYRLDFRPSPAEINANPIWRFFEKHSFEWLIPRGELEAHTMPIMLPPWDDKVIALNQRHPDLQQTIIPVSFSTHSPDKLPPVKFWCVLSPVNTDPKRDFDRIVTALKVDLGPYQTTQSVNVYSAIWESGPAKIKVLVWPKHLNPHQYRADSWKGDPATREAVHIYFETGLAFHLHDSERHLMLSARALDVPDAALITSSQHPAFTDLSLLRRLPIAALDDFQTLRGNFLFNEPTRHLFLVFEGYALIIPLNIALGLGLDRVTPAKGSGYSRLYLLLEPWNQKHKRMLTLASGAGPDDLTLMAQSLGLQLGLSVEIRPYEPDC